MDIYKKSFEILKKIAKAQKQYNFEIVLIGGWAVWIYNKYLKSKDIDIIVSEKDFWKLRNLLIQMGFSETHGGHLGKKGFAKLVNTDKIEIDVYDKKIGRTDVKPIIERSVEQRINGFKFSVANVTDLFALKLNSLSERIGSAKGEKDISDLLAILDKSYDSIDWNMIDKRILADMFKVLLGNFKTTQNFYRMDINKYKKIRSLLLKLF